VTSFNLGETFEISVGEPKEPGTPTTADCSTSHCVFLPIVRTPLLLIPTGHAWTSYYYAAGNRIAMRVQSNQQGIEDSLYYLLSDHLGSTAITLDESGNQVAELRYSAWGESRYTSGDTPTQYRYTGQRSEAEIGLYYYVARFYDATLGRFLSADSVVPNIGNPISYDRYAYGLNNPIRYFDPSGHYACGDGYEDGCIFEREAAKRQVEAAGYRPDVGCASDALCWDSYATFIQVVVGMGSVPSLNAILMMTAGTEYFDYSGNKDVRAVGQEGLARNYYSACGTDGCQGNELYKFMSGFQPWYGSPYVKGDGSAAARAGHLMVKGLGHTLASDMKKDVAQIVDSGFAESQRWTNGKYPNEPWQWYTFAMGSGKDPSFGYGPENDAILSVDLANGYVFWMFTAAQDGKFNPEEWR